MIAKRDVLRLAPAALVGGLGGGQAQAPADGRGLAEDERHIGALLTSYATAIDRRDWKLFASCWTEDVVLDYHTLGRWEGRDAVVATFERMHAPFGPSLHKLSNFVIMVNGKRAKASSYVDSVLMQPKPRPMIFRGEGRYEDELVHGAEGWRIKAREFHPVLMTQSPQ